MPEAVKAVIDYCFQELSFDYLTCGHFDRNDAAPPGWWKSAASGS